MKVQASRRFAAVLALAIVGSTTAGSKTTVGDVEQGVVELLKQEGWGASRVSGIPVGESDKDLVIEQFQKLFREQPIEQFTTEWLNANPSLSGNDLYANWLVRYMRTVSAGLLH